MIHSLTGYGKSVLQLPSKTISIELKSLNSKTLDLNMRMPSMYRSKELSLRKLIAAKLNRGKVDFSMNLENTGGETFAKVNPKVVKKYMAQLEGLATGDEMQRLQMAIKMPDAISTERDEINETEWSDIEREIQKALENIAQYRLEEGNVLEADFRKRIAVILDLLEQVLAIDPERISNVRERLHKGVSDLKEKYDENRFEQELVYYIEKFDITEEKVRLQNHLEYFIQTLNSEDSNGKKLGFISQEIGREVNTIGSKANFAPMQKLVVQMKDELEKIKEQLLNVL